MGSLSTYLENKRIMRERAALYASEPHPVCEDGVMFPISAARQQELKDFTLADGPTMTERFGKIFTERFERDRLFAVLFAALFIMFAVKGCAAQPPKIPAPAIESKYITETTTTAPASTPEPAPTMTQAVASAPELEYEMHVTATAYWTHDPVDASGHGIAFDGTPAVAYKTIAVDPKVIPLQSQVYVPGFGWMRANDTGNAIKGAIIDIAMDSRDAAFKWGRRKLLVKVRPPKEG